MTSLSPLTVRISHETKARLKNIAESRDENFSQTTGYLLNLAFDLQSGGASVTVADGRPDDEPESIPSLSAGEVRALRNLLEKKK